MQTDLKNIVRFLVENLVDDATGIEITDSRNEEGIITVHVVCPEREIGKLIGKDGRIANAARVIMKAVSMKTKQKSLLDIRMAEVAA